MLAALLALLPEAPEAAAEHAGAAAEAAEEPWIVEQVNHLLGPAVLQIERAIMPSIYGLFGAHWHEPAAGATIIPEHVVLAVILMIISIAGALALRRPLSVERPSNGRQLLEVDVDRLPEPPHPAT